MLVMEIQKISQDLIDQLKQHNIANQELIIAFGQVEIQIQELQKIKNTLITNLESQKQNEKQLSETLQSKYGDGNINLETGEFTPIK